MKKDYKEYTKRIMKISAWVLLLLIAIEAFRVFLPYSITMGIMLLSVSTLFFPFKKIDIPKKGKWFIVGINFLAAAYLVKPEDINYIKCILPTIIIILSWVITVWYFKGVKNEKDNRTIKKSK